MVSVGAVGDSNRRWGEGEDGISIQERVGDMVSADTDKRRTYENDDGWDADK